MQSTWSPSDWRGLGALQQPDWPDPEQLTKSVGELSGWPPLVFAGEARELRESIAQAAAGNAFILQAGDCAESFEDHSADGVRDKLKVILQMSAVLTYAAGSPIVKIARIAGQFAKPRSSPTETVGDVQLPSFRGHMVNSDAPNADARIPDPKRLLEAYHRASATLNLLRAFTDGGFADLTRVHQWNVEFVKDSPQGQRYESVASGIESALKFMRACGVDMEANEFHRTTVWTSHEALLLDYEEALTRKDSLTGDWYDCSGHMLWIGERTRDPDGAHVNFLSGVENPIGVKIGPSATPEDVVKLCDKLDPSFAPGRLTLITRMGHEKVSSSLKPILQTVSDTGHPVAWVCDPMHGNTFTSRSGRKTRNFNDIIEEINATFAIHGECGTIPGGIHLEITNEAVTECIGGGENLKEEDLENLYTTLCDPRLNGRQSLDLAFHIAELMH
ncbi:MAG: class II 3-deoxy-7-phosphoheptulonate synthase [Actinomycetota bacterium]